MATFSWIALGSLVSRMLTVSRSEPMDMVYAAISILAGSLLGVLVYTVALGKYPKVTHGVLATMGLVGSVLDTSCMSSDAVRTVGVGLIAMWLSTSTWGTKSLSRTSTLFAPIIIGAVAVAQSLLDCYGAVSPGVASLCAAGLWMWRQRQVAGGGDAAERDQLVSVNAEKDQVGYDDHVGQYMSERIQCDTALRVGLGMMAWSAIRIVLTATTSMNAVVACVGAAGVVGSMVLVVSRCVHGETYSWRSWPVMISASGVLVMSGIIFSGRLTDSSGVGYTIILAVGASCVAAPYFVSYVVTPRGSNISVVGGLVLPAMWSILPDVIVAYHHDLDVGIQHVLLVVLMVVPSIVVVIMGYHEGAELAGAPTRAASPTVEPPIIIEPSHTDSSQREGSNDTVAATIAPSKAPNGDSVEVRSPTWKADNNSLPPAYGLPPVTDEQYYLAASSGRASSHSHSKSHDRSRSVTVSPEAQANECIIS
eukprot:PhF_6_TR39645/c0_g1_i2/m.58800